MLKINNVKIKKVMYSINNTLKEVKSIKTKYNNQMVTVYQNQSFPDEYQKVEYIQSTGTQYLDTGISCTGGIRCIFNATYQNRGYICGAHGLSEPYGRCGASQYNTRWELGYGNTYQQTGRHSTDVNYDVEYQTFYDSAYLKVKGGSYNDWTTLITSSGQTTTSLNALVFTQQYAIRYGEAKTRAKLYSLKIYDSNEQLKGDFIPCYRKSDNVIGLYNMVNGDFLTNQGTGTFSKGNDVN